MFNSIFNSIKSTEYACVKYCLIDFRIIRIIWVARIYLFKQNVSSVQAFWQFNQYIIA